MVLQNEITLRTSSAPLFCAPRGPQVTPQRSPSNPSQTVAISPELRKIIDLYLKHHPTYKPSTDPPVQLLVTFDGVPFTKNNDITRMLYKIFDNKKVGVNMMLRHIYLTDKYKDVMSKMKQDATQMGTSSNMVQDHYIKVD
jgi:integrase